MPVDSGRYPSGQRGQTVNLLANAFGGSNPPLPTILTTEGVATTRGNSSAVERQPSKLGVAGSNPVSRSRFADIEHRPGWAGAVASVGGLGAMSGPPCKSIAHVAQMAERVLGKDEVSGSIPDMGSIVMGVELGTVNGR